MVPRNTTISAITISTTAPLPPHRPLLFDYTLKFMFFFTPTPDDLPLTVHPSTVE